MIHANPFYAFLELRVGPFNLTPIPPQYLINFNYTRRTNSEANTFSFSVFDKTAYELEAILSSYFDDVSFRYGYSLGPASPLYTAQIHTYGLEFQAGGVVLSVEGFTKGIASYNIPRKKVYRNMTIDQIVRAIADQEGWGVGKIEPCAPVYEYDGLTDAPVMKGFVQNNVPSVKFIKSDLIKYAKSAKTGESGFEFYFDDDNEERPVINFCLPVYKKKPYKTFYYEFNRSGDGEVLSFQPDIKGLFTFTGGGLVEASTVEKYKNDFLSENRTIYTNPEQLKTAPRSVISYDSKKTVYASSSETIDGIKNRISNLWYQNLKLMYPATLSVIGDPTLLVHKNIVVIVMMENGQPHHTSGVYFIREISDDIQGGSFTSNMSLTRIGLGKGNEEQIGRLIDNT